MKLLVLVVLTGLAIAEEKERVVNKAFLSGFNKFTSDLYKEIEKTSAESFVVSPLSVDLILSLTEYGSKGETSKQLVKGLGIPEDKAKFRKAVSALTPKLNVNETYTLTSANKIYVKEGYKLNADFQKIAVDVYNAEIDNVDFLKSEAAAGTINKWIEDRTNQKIKDLISKDDLDKTTRAVLINALYFKGEWNTKFKEYQTKKEDFYLDSATQTQVDMMYIKYNFRYLESEELNAQLLELPYKGYDVTLTIVLPNEKDGLKNLTDNIQDVLDVSGFRYKLVVVKLPKFKIESKIEFKPILQNLGIKDAFEDTADISQITDEPLKISKIVQKALIDVDESGTTAAVATGEIITPRGFILDNREPKQFIADHPFVFVLKYKSVVLFVGQYNGK